MKLIIFLLTFGILTANPFEEGIKEATYYTTPQGHELRYTCFKSPIKGAKNTVFFIQGRGTFLEFYEVLITPLLERGFDVWMYDLSGQGGSSRLPLKGKHDELTAQKMQHVETFDLYIDDAASFFEAIVKPQAQGDIYLGGYSTGGHIALRLMQKIPDLPFKAAFVLSPLLKMRAPLPNTCLTYLLGGAGWVVDLETYVPGMGPVDPVFTAPFAPNPYSSDPERYQELQTLCIDYTHWMMGAPSLGWIKAAVNSIEVLWHPQALQAIQIPLLIATGENDGVVDVSYNALFAEKLPLATHVSYPEGRHELFREAPAILEAWWQDFDEFRMHR